MRKKIIFYLFLFVISLSQAVSAEQIKLGIVPFTSGTKEVPESQAILITDTMIKALQASSSIAVIERERLRVIAMEQGLNVSSNNQDSIAKLGKLAGCQYIVLGTVSQLTRKGFFDPFHGGILPGVITLEIRLIDVTSGKIALSFSQNDSAVIMKTFSGTAIQTDVSSKIAEKLRKVLANEYAMIIGINKNNIRINRGSLSGVNVGSLYKVYQEGEELFGLNGKSLGKRFVNLALLRVTNVHDEFSTAEIINKDNLNQQDTKKSQPKKVDKTAKSKSKKTSKSKKEENVVSTTPVLIREGDKIEAISFAEAEKLNLASQRIGEDK